MRGFLLELKTQRWDDHRYYHHSRINQSLHFLSAVSFICAYATMFIDPVKSALIGWLISMVSRQSGHFFFEPKGYDAVNRASHEHKEQIKIGYNLRRKVILHAAWAAAPLLLLASPTCFGLLRAPLDGYGFMRNVGKLWLALGMGALLFRTVQLFFIRNARTGLVWITKILTDPFNDAILYCKAPLHLLRGELIDPMGEVLAECEALERQRA